MEGWSYLPHPHLFTLESNNPQSDLIANFRFTAASWILELGSLAEKHDSCSLTWGVLGRRVVRPHRSFVVDAMLFS